MSFKKRSLLYSVILVSGLGLISKVVGLIREGVFSYYLGTSDIADDFFLVYGFLSNVTTILGSSIGIAFIPIFLQILKEKGEKQAVINTSHLLNQIFIFSLGVSLIMFFFPKFCAHCIAPTYSDERIDDISRYIKLFSCIVFFATAIYIYSSVLDAQKRFGISRIIGMSYSITTIIFIVILYRSIGLKALIYGVIASFIIQYILSVFFLHKNYKYSFSLNLKKNSPVIKVYKQTIPVFIGTGTLVIGQFIDRTVASTLESGSVAALSYSGTLHSLINTLLIASIVTVFYTDFSEKFLKNEINQMMDTLKKGFNFLIVILVPVSIFFIVNSKDIITILLQRGAFTKESVAITATAFSFYLIGTTFFGIRNLLTRVFYAIGDIKTPLINGLISIILNIIICLSFVFIFNSGVKGITLASSITAMFSTCLLSYSLHKNEYKIEYTKILKNFIAVLSVALVCAFVDYIILIYIDNLPLVIKLFISGFSFFLLFMIILKIIGNNEIDILYALLFKNKSKKNV